MWLIGHYSLLLIKQDNKKHLWNFWSRCDSHTYIFLASFFYLNKLFILLVSCSMAKKWPMITRMISLWKESVTRTYQIIVLWKKNIAQQFTLKKSKFFLVSWLYWKRKHCKYNYFKQSSPLVFNADFCLKWTRLKGNYRLFLK